MSVLRYPGGKSRAIKHIFPYIPDDTTHLYSPFFGGGSIELTCAKEKPLIQSVKANDKFEPLINFWKVAQQNQDSLVTELCKIHSTMTKEGFMTYRDNIKHEPDNMKR